MDLFLPQQLRYVLWDRGFKIRWIDGITFQIMRKFEILKARVLWGQSVLLIIQLNEFRSLK